MPDLWVEMEESSYPSLPSKKGKNWEKRKRKVEKFSILQYLLLNEGNMVSS